MSSKDLETAVHSAIEVPVDAQSAFRIFTEEVDCWWLQGPINFHDSSKAVGHLFEPRVGGRLIEVYDTDTGEGLELARITDWTPGERLAWKSSIDDVSIEVTFRQIAENRTEVLVSAGLSEGGEDHGGTAWVRMSSVWLPRWMARRGHAEKRALNLSALAVAVHYDKPATAARWLETVFRLELASDLPEEDTKDEYTWIEFHVGGRDATASVIVLPRQTPAGASEPTHTIWVFVNDLDALHSHIAQSGGAPGDIWQHGPRAFEVADLEGYKWTFAQAGPAVVA